jgi:hypothetical protein
VGRPAEVLEGDIQEVAAEVVNWAQGRNVILRFFYPSGLTDSENYRVYPAMYVIFTG